jgi:uncharacterized protein with GYD domain
LDYDRIVENRFLKGELDMSTYLLFGKYSKDSIGQISAARTKSAASVIGDSGGQLKGGYALLGEKDLVLIAELPSTEAAMKASVGLSKLLGIGFTTAPAVTVEEFDKLFAKG